MLESAKISGKCFFELHLKNNSKILINFQNINIPDLDKISIDIISG